MRMQRRAAVPKFGTWDSDNAGYTAYFDKVRENKGATAPPLHRPHNPNDPEEGPLMRVPPPTSSSSRPATSSGHREPAPRRHHGQQTHHHRRRRTESSSSMASDPGARGGAERSMFAPPPQYNPRPSPQPHQQYQHHGGHHQHHYGPGGGGYRDRHAQQRQQQHHAAAPAPRARSASPQSNAPSRHQRPSAVPKFGVWDEQTAASAAQGFTVQFENVKRHRERARTAVPAVPRVASPPEGAAARHAHHQKTPFVSKMFGCFLPTTPREDREPRCI